MTIDILKCPPTEGLAFAADCTIEECRQHGARWTLRRLLERQAYIASIAMVTRLSEGGLSFGKTVVARATEAFVDALGAALDRRDETAAIAIATEWSLGRRAESEALVRGLLEVFAEKQEAS